MEKKQKAKYIISDTLSAMLAWAALFLFRKVALEHLGFSDAADVFSDSNFWLGLILVPLGWLSLYTIQGAYRNVLRRARLTELLDTLLASLIGVVVIFFVLLVDDNINTYLNYYASFLFLFFVHFTFTYIPRLIITTHTVNAVHTRRLGFPTVMIGSGPRALQTYTDLESQETYSGNLFVGYVDINQEANHSASQSLQNIMPRLGTIADLRTVIKEHAVEEAIVALEPDEKERLSDILLAINSCGDIIIKITPDARDIAVGSIHQRSIFHSPFILINNRLMPEWQYSLKRIADIVISLFALILLSPVYLVTAIIVKATSPGPIFYAQERIGHLGKPFKMHKFRSMYVDAEEAGPALSKDDDPRITPFGRFMRKVRLDEIPQFYNVLRGTMSLVGPRPERQYYIDQIVKRAPEYMLLQRVKPGITSWGQVKYGYASNVDQMVERLRYDLLYLDNMSLTTDLKILLYTVIIIFEGRGK
ncbi:MAG: sugar transferase [Bacteroidales bacterium]|nr:sugar transferase [Bacteroidales bacterium]